MSKLLDCFEKVYAKDYRHRDNTRVLTKADKRALVDDVAERIATGEKPLDAAKAAVGRMIEQTQAQMADVYRQAGVPMSKSEMTPEARDAEYLAAVERGDIKAARDMVEAAGKDAGIQSELVADWRNGGFVRVPAIYLRFGDLPEGVSGRWHGNKKVGSEKGVSVYAAWRDKITGKYMMLDRAREDTSGVEDMGITRPIFEVSGRVLDDVGGDGEPLLEYGNIKTVGKIPPSDITTDDLLSIAIDGTEWDEPLDPSTDTTFNPVVRDAAGNVIPLSERFNPANDDIRYSRPEPDMPEEDVEEEAPTPRTAQVFGRKGTAPVVPSSQARTVPIIRRDFFDGTVPVSPAATLNAAALIRTMMGRETGPAYADKLRAAVDPLDQNIAMGLLRREVDNYGLAALAAGDRSIYEMMQRYATTDWFIGKREDGTPYTYRDVAQELAGNSRLPTTKGAVARDTVNESRDEANTEGFSTALGDPDLGKKAYTDIRDTVDNTGLDEGEIAGIASTPVGGETLGEKVDKLVEKKKKAKKSEAEKLLDMLAKSQSDTQTNKKPQINIIREIYRQALKLTITDDNLRTWLTSKLSAAEVKAPTLDPLVTAIITERRNRAAVSTAKTGQALAEGRRGSLRELEKQLTETPAFLQRQPEWRRRLILDYFMQTGLSKPQAQMLARIYEAEFVKRLEVATQRAMDRLLESKVPWARKAAAVPKKKKQVSDQVDKLMKAVRLGLTDPYAIWDEEMARRNNWKGFTPTQHARLEEIDMILTQVSTLPNERARLLLEVDKMITAAKLPPKLADKILHSYVASALSGLSTTLVQGSAHVGLVMKTLATAAADPLSIPSLMKQFAAIAKTTANETAFAIKTGAYRSAPLDTLQGHERPLEYMWNRGFEQMKSDRPLDRAKGLVNIITGSQNYVMRTLSSLDQGYITGAAELSAMVFTKDLLRKIGMSRAEANAVIEETLRAKDAFYQKLRAIGETHLQASADATDVHMRRLYQTIADRDFEYDGMTAEEWAEDIRKGSVLESEGPTGRVSSAEVVGDPNSEEGARRIGPLDEGVLRRIILWPLKGITEAQGKGGIDALTMRSLFGFLSVPVRTAGWYAGYSPYGFVRAGIHKFQTSRGKRSPYAQTYGSKSQMQQRLREASAGSVAAVLLALLATATADDDDEKKNAIFVTGGGPSFNDMALRDAWMKRFKPYSIVVKIDGKYHAFNYGRMFESIGWAATIAGTIDDVSIRRKAKESRGGNMAMLDAFAGNILGNVVERSSFKSMVNNAVLLSRAKESGTDLRIASQATFTASALLPWKSALNTIQRVYAEPVDNNTITGSVWASTPLLGPVMGQTSVNIFGDSLGDTSPGGRFFSVGLPSFGAPRGGKAYDLVLQHGRGPSNYQRNQFSKTFETDDLDPTYREFVIRRGRKLKAAMEANYDRLKTVDTETYAEFLKRVTESINAQVASEMKLKRTAKK